MYEVTSGTFIGYADSIVPIRLHKNGCYVPCPVTEADGFCAKLADSNALALADAVFHLPGKVLRGTEPEGTYQPISGALALADTEQAAKILLGEAE